MLFGLDGVEVGLIIVFLCLFGGIMSGFPVAFANAVADALRPAGVEITRLPLHGDVLHQLLENTESTKNTATTATTTKETTPWH